MRHALITGLVLGIFLLGLVIGLNLGQVRGRQAEAAERGLSWRN